MGFVINNMSSPRWPGVRFRAEYTATGTLIAAEKYRGVTEETISHPQRQFLIARGLMVAADRARRRYERAAAIA